MEKSFEGSTNNLTGFNIADPPVDSTYILLCPASLKKKVETCSFIVLCPKYDSKKAVPLHTDYRGGSELLEERFPGIIGGCVDHRDSISSQSDQLSSKLE
ncbi:hypothetical protein RRG08_033218 [Elysia crispata]|uniref:Uncharacterized protein n=1 Tax=Elysia crispata TaxID=231223 RepID=A0AAE1ECH9_9GAST|nr:hypothetical protein RRG08_033218 [Elysia crispata]